MTAQAERAEALVTYADAIAALGKEYDRRTGVMVGVVIGFSLGCRLGLMYPEVAREMAVAIEGGTMLGSPMPTGVGEEAEVMNRRIVDVLGKP